MKSELDETKEKLEQAQNDLSAWKFTPDRYKYVYMCTYRNFMFTMLVETVIAENFDQIFSAYYNVKEIDICIIVKW